MRKICVVVGSRANYSSIKSAMRAIQAHPDLELQVVVGASALLDRYGSLVDVMDQEEFTGTGRYGRDKLVTGDDGIRMTVEWFRSRES